MLVGVSLACLSYDVLGIIAKIIDGELPETDPEAIMGFDPHAGIALNDNTGINILRPGAPEDGDIDAEDNPDIDEALSSGYSDVFGDDDDDDAGGEEAF